MENGNLWAIAGLVVVFALLVIVGLEKYERCKAGDRDSCRWSGGRWSGGLPR